MLADIDSMAKYLTMKEPFDVVKLDLISGLQYLVGII